jgi:hypothetical protein
LATQAPAKEATRRCGCAAARGWRYSVATRIGLEKHGTGCSDNWSVPVASLARQLKWPNCGNSHQRHFISAPLRGVYLDRLVDQPHRGRPEPIATGNLEILRLPGRDRAGEIGRILVDKFVMIEEIGLEVVPLMVMSASGLYSHSLASEYEADIFLGLYRIAGLFHILKHHSF